MLNEYPPSSTEIASKNDYIDLSTYEIALEGWQRGLKVKWHKNNRELPDFLNGENRQFLSLSYKDRTHYFYKSAGDKITNEAIITCMDKAKLSRLLANKNFTARQVSILTANITNYNIQSEAEKINGPVIIYFENKYIRTLKILLFTDKSIVNATLSKMTLDKDIQRVIIKQFIPYDWYRFYIINEQIVEAVKISYNESYLAKLSTNRVVSISEVNNLYKKKSVEDFDQIPNQMREKAIKISRAIRGLSHGSVDITACENKLDKEKIIVLDVNPIADITAVGFRQSNCISSKLLDFYFPETIHNKRLNDSFCFDYKRAVFPITYGSANVSIVKHNHFFSYKSLKFIVEGPIPNIDLMFLIKDYAHKHNIVGSVSKDASSIIIIAVGKEQYLREFKKIVQKELNKRQYKEIKVTDYKGTVKSGFEIINGTTMLLNEIESLKKQYSDIEKEKVLLEEEYHSMLNSLRWKITFPLRKFSSILKKIIRRN